MTDLTEIKRDLERGGDADQWPAAAVRELVAMVEEWRQAAGAEANLADERGRRLHDRDHALEVCREVVARLREDRDGLRESIRDWRRSHDVAAGEAMQAKGLEGAARSAFAEVTRLRDGIKAALDCHTEPARRVTLQRLLDPQNANEAPQP